MTLDIARGDPHRVQYELKDRVEDPLSLATTQRFKDVSRGLDERVKTNNTRMGL